MCEVAGELNTIPKCATLRVLILHSLIMKKPIIVSGIQPTGDLHIGNYLGAVKNWVTLQNSDAYECFFFVADLHSLTNPMGAQERREKSLILAAELIAAGLDPKKSTIFIQSHVPAHTELAWIFNSVTPVAELERMTQFKDKSAQHTKHISAGLFTYPVLQAADILLYHATNVPVGEDQVQHVELTRDIARWFNKRFSDYFPETKAILTKTSRIKSLVDPVGKMSKSKGVHHTVDLADEPNIIEKKIKKAVTASEGGGENPGALNLLLLLKEFGDEATYKQFSAAEKDGSIRYGDLKAALSSSIAEHFAPFRARRAQLLEQHDELAQILAEGAERANAIAEKTIADVRKIVGIR